MAKRLLATVALLAGVGSQLPAQQFPPGQVDPAPLLAAAAKEISEANLKCITFSGTGYSGPVGQTFENAVGIDWPRSEMANYTRTINWETGTSKETFDRKPGLNPASWKYGLGWQGGTPTQKDARQTHIVNGKFAWHMDGNGPPVAVPPEQAEVYQLDLWLNPPRLPQGRAHARRQPQSLLAVGAAREGAGRQRRGAREDARGRDHDVREVPRGGHDQPAESDSADQDHRERQRPRRFQHRA